MGLTLSCYANKLGALFEIANSLFGTFMGPMLAILRLGMFTRRCDNFSAIPSGTIGKLAAVFLAFIGPINQSAGGSWAISTVFGSNGLYVFQTLGAISSAWIAPTGLFITLFFGIVFGSRRYTERTRQWNRFGIIKRPLID